MCANYYMYSMGSIPAIPEARIVLVLLCHERFQVKEASLPVQVIYIYIYILNHHLYVHIHTKNSIMIDLFWGQAPGIPTLWINWDILVYRAEKRGHPMLYDIILYLRIYEDTSRYHEIYWHKLAYTSICFRREYILVYSSLRYMTVYEGIW